MITLDDARGLIGRTFPAGRITGVTPPRPGEAELRFTVTSEEFEAISVAEGVVRAWLAREAEYLVEQRAACGEAS